jgi:hypothetical protein
MRLDDCAHDLDSLGCEALALSQHGHRLTDAGGHAEIDFERSSAVRFQNCEKIVGHR